MFDSLDCTNTIKSILTVTFGSIMQTLSLFELEGKYCSMSSEDPHQQSYQRTLERSALTELHSIEAETETKESDGHRLFLCQLYLSACLHIVKK
jgi:hypothetical protein